MPQDAGLTLRERRAPLADKDLPVERGLLQEHNRHLRHRRLSASAEADGLNERPVTRTRPLHASSMTRANRKGNCSARPALTAQEGEEERNRTRSLRIDA